MRSGLLLVLLLCACGDDSAGVSDLAGAADLATSDLAAAVVTAIAVSPAQPKILVGDTVAMTAMATYTDASTADVTAKVAWSSSVTATATISAAGVATGVAAGTTMITAALGGVTSAALPLAVRTVSSVALTWPGGGALANATIAGATVPFTATATLSDADLLDVTQRATWSSSETTIATVNGSGVAQPGNNGGTTTITASFAGKDGTATLLVQ